MVCDSSYQEVLTWIGVGIGLCYLEYQWAYMSDALDRYLYRNDEGKSLITLFREQKEELGLGKNLWKKLFSKNEQG